MQGHWLSFLVAGLPRLVREESRYVLASALLFLLPLLAAVLLLQAYPDGVYMVMSPESVVQYEEMYSPSAERLGRQKTASDELTMLAFYIANNVRIDFQCFAGGIAFGLGPRRSRARRSLHRGRSRRRPTCRRSRGPP